MSNSLLFGLGVIKQLSAEIIKLSPKKVLVVTDKGIVDAGIFEKIKDILNEGNISYSLFDKVEPDPKIEIVNLCRKAAIDSKADLLVGLGGGSALDITKVTAIMLTNEGSIGDYFGVNRVPKRGIKTILIPTTSGTGSEVTPIAVLSDKEEKLKKGIVSPHLTTKIY